MRHSFLRGVIGGALLSNHSHAAGSLSASFDSAVLGNMSPPLRRALHPLPVAMHLEMRTLHLPHKQPPKYY